MDVQVINANDIEDAWFQCIWNIIDNGYKYIIEHGSFIGNQRLEFDFAVIKIKNAYKEPYDLMLPKTPSHYNIPDPVCEGYIEQYLPYLMTADIQYGEDYTYGERICEVLSHINGIEEIYISQIEHFIKILKETPNTNQAILQIARPEDCLLEDSPCLRHIDMRVKNNKLIFYPYFRSWDLWGGFPANLAGIAVLQKYMADEIGIEIGEIVASSKGLHIYEYVEEMAKIRANK